MGKKKSKRYLLRYRKWVARLVVKLVYEPGNSRRNLRCIHKNFILFYQGVDYDTFLSYLDEEKDDLKDLIVSDGIILGIVAAIRFSFDPKATVSPELRHKLETTPIPRRRRKKKE